MKMGFLGGVLSVAWPLLKPLEEQPGMLYRHEEIEGNLFTRLNTFLTRVSAT